MDKRSIDIKAQKIMRSSPQIISNRIKNPPMIQRISNAKRPKPINQVPTTKIEKFPPMEGTFKHTGDLGDLWYSLPVIRFLGGGTMYLNPNGFKSKKIDGSASGLTKDLINMCKPLLELQSYIKAVDIWDESKKIIVDIDSFRRNFGNKSTLCETILASFSVPFTETEKPWIECEPKKIAKTVFARSFRYRNKQTKYKELLQENKNDAIFVGLPIEHHDFQNNFGKIDYYSVNDFLELAQVINGSELFVGNQSSPMALAIAMHKNFIQESYTSYPDCRFERANAKYM